MKLYFSPGACSLAPHIALREADRKFELERVSLRTRRTASGEDYRRVNPKGYVPALALDHPAGVVLTEVTVILLYIADLVPERNLAPPSGTFARYRIQEWLSFISGEVHKQFGPLWLPDTPVPVAERQREKLRGRFSYVASELADHPYLTGETFTVADCLLFPMLRWCERFDIDLQRWPNLADYFDRLVQRPTVLASLAAEGLLEPKRYRRTA